MNEKGRCAHMSQVEGLVGGDDSHRGNRVPEASCGAAEGLGKVFLALITIVKRSTKFGNNGHSVFLTQSSSQIAACGMVCNDQGEPLRLIEGKQRVVILQ